jgi:hypothetical protein
MLISEKLAAAVATGKGVKFDAEQTRLLHETVELMSAVQADMAGLRTAVAELRRDRAKIKDGLRRIAVYLHNDIPDSDILARAIDSYTVTGPKGALLETLADLLTEIREHDNAVARLELRDLDFELTSFQ